MNRDEHLQWAKDRALKEESGVNMWTSFVSDMHKHEELQDHGAINLGNMMLISENFSDINKAKKFILGFN